MAARHVRERVQLDGRHPAKGTYRLFPSTNGPSSPVSYSGPFMAGVLFKVTTGGMLVRRILVVGIPVRAVHLGAEIRAVVRL